MFTDHYSISLRRSPQLWSGRGKELSSQLTPNPLKTRPQHRESHALIESKQPPVASGFNLFSENPCGS